MFFSCYRVNVKDLMVPKVFWGTTAMLDSTMSYQLP